MIRAVLDANVVISGMIAPLGISASILQAWRAGKFEVATCPDILEEVFEKLRLPRIRKKYRIRDEDIDDLLLLFGEASLLMPGNTPFLPLPPDPDDLMVFAAAIESQAD